jgi:hypothetical protein
MAAQDSGASRLKKRLWSCNEMHDHGTLAWWYEKDGCKLVAAGRAQDTPVSNSPTSHEPTQPQQEVRAWLVEVTTAQEIPLANKKDITIGRMDDRKGIFPDVDLTPVDPGRTASREHARIIRNDDSTFSVIDNGRATNGTYLNGSPLAAGEITLLKRGDSLIFGTVWCRFHYEKVLVGAPEPDTAGEAEAAAVAPPERRSEFAFGMNENIEVDGRDFHTQTEDLGWDQESILTVVYSAGAIVFTRKTPYSFFRERRGEDFQPSHMVQFQHRSIVAGIKAGKYQEWFSSS